MVEDRGKGGVSRPGKPEDALSIIRTKTSIIYGLGELGKSITWQRCRSVSAAHGQITGLYKLMDKTTGVRGPKVWEGYGNKSKLNVGVLLYCGGHCEGTKLA